MQVRRLSVKQLNIGSIYLAFSAKNKMLSSPVGTFVKLEEVNGASIKVRVLGTETPPLASIRNLDTRSDAWLYDPSGIDLPMKLCADLDENQWPRWTPRLQASEWRTRPFTLDMSRLYVVDRAGEAGHGVTMVRMEDPDTNPATGRPFVTNFPLNWMQPASPPEWRVPRAERMGMGVVELPLPPKPVKPEHEEALNVLMPLLKKMNKAHNAENTTFIKVAEDMKEYELHANQACHRAVQEEEDFEPHYVLTIGFNTATKGSWVKGRPNDEALELWITYLTCYSPWADVFITKDVKFIIEHGYVLDTNQPNRLFASACYATRQAWETPWRANAFLEFYKSGVPLDAAFIFAAQCSVFADGKMKLAFGSAGHNYFQSKSASNQCLINFIKHTPERAGKIYREDCHASSGEGGVDGMWSKKYSQGSDIYKKLSEIKRQGVPPHLAAMPADEVVEVAADLIDEWMGHHGLI